MNFGLHEKKWVAWNEFEFWSIGLSERSYKHTFNSSSAESVNDSVNWPMVDTKSFGVEQSKKTK